MCMENPGLWPGFFFFWRLHDFHAFEWRDSQVCSDV